MASPGDDGGSPPAAPEQPESGAGTPAETPGASAGYVSEPMSEGNPDPFSDHPPSDEEEEGEDLVGEGMMQCVRARARARASERTDGRAGASGRGSARCAGASAGARQRA